MTPPNIDEAYYNRAALTELVNGVSQLAMQLQQGNQMLMNAVTAPKRVTYDQAGRPSGVEIAT